jgi:rubrerythrin
MPDSATEHVHNLVLEALEHEMGGVAVYEAALESARNRDLRKEWQEYLSQTRHHVEVLRELCESMGLDPDASTPGRELVKQVGESLVQTIETARSGPDAQAAQLVAVECVVLAETKDHLNWELIGELAGARDTRKHTGALAKALESVEDEEDEHLYHSQGWARELWLQSLGLPAVLPPPEEKKDVKTAIGAARAKEQRGKMLPADR